MVDSRRAASSSTDRGNRMPFSRPMGPATRRPAPNGTPRPTIPFRPIRPKRPCTPRNRPGRPFRPTCANRPNRPNTPLHLNCPTRPNCPGGVRCNASTCGRCRGLLSRCCSVRCPCSTSARLGSTLADLSRATDPSGRLGSLSGLVRSGLSSVRRWPGQLCRLVSHPYAQFTSAKLFHRIKLPLRWVARRQPVKKTSDSHSQRCHF